MEISIGLLQTIGSTLGVPLAITLCVMWMEIKALKKRLEEGDRRMTRIEDDAKRTEAMLQEIRANVAYIKGKIDGGEHQ